jgi:hypothetical protein
MVGLGGLEPPTSPLSVVRYTVHHQLRQSAMVSYRVDSTLVYREILAHAAYYSLR